MSRETRRITVPATLEHLATLTVTVTDLLREHGIPEKNVFEVDLAVDEACTNVIRYAYGAGQGEVTVECTVTPDEVEVCISDHGHRFDPLAVETPDLTGGVEDRPIGGLGVHLIRSLMDRVTYEYREGKNILCMAKVRERGANAGESDHL
ncbi:MAG: ATP-binding protein [Methanolinea sp.]|jgi:serine/threonine-protein kinase RsbW|nr:ATP-binding protein [Methanolinea sp.]